jgi:hypothetical protein
LFTIPFSYANGCRRRGHRLRRLFSNKQTPAERNNASKIAAERSVTREISVLSHTVDAGSLVTLEPKQGGVTTWPRTKRRR